MSGRWAINIMIIGTVAMAVLFYFALKKAPEYKGLVTDQMSMEFTDYSHQIKNTDFLKVAELAGKTYVVSTQTPWKFEIRDKILFVTVPAPENSTDHEALPKAALPQARKAAEDFLWIWVEDKFHTRKDLQLEVHFVGEDSFK